MPSTQAPRPHVVVVGAGPGGLTSAMLLARRGFKVTVCEREDHVGGRNAAIRLNGYTFDTGPTFLMLKDILDEVFEESDRHSGDYLEFSRLEPMYRLQFSDQRVEPTTDHEGMRREIERAFPGQSGGLEKYYRVEKRRFELMYPCLQKSYSKLSTLLHPDLLRALPHLALGRTLFSVLGDYFKPERLRLSFTFQAKYLGMSPWECPGLFTILSLIEHTFGVYHVKGGLSEISEAMAKVVGEHGGEIRLGTTVRQLWLEGRKVLGVELESGERLAADEVVINADFAHAMSTLVPSGVLRKYTPERLRKREFSCSTFMLYLGVDRTYDLPHHTIFFAKDYRTNVEDIFRNKRLTDDFSFYVRNADVTDPTLAPKGHSALYVLVPVTNQSSGVDWTKERDRFRGLVIKAMEERGGFTDLSRHIRAEKVITPLDWERDHHVFLGATFNLSHKISQMLYLRPRNRFEELDRCYLVGGGTHPGSGLPTIYESGRIAANLISKAHHVPYVSKNLEI